jgi:hypothetical protein
VRAHFYDKTLPWKDNGDRLLTRLMFRDFIEEHERLVGEFKDAVEQFVTTGYPQAREKAEFRMGELFNANDYPAPDSLRRRFYINMDIDAVTEAGDFRVEMDAGSSTGPRVDGAGDARAARPRHARRLGAAREVVGHFAKKMGSDDIFRDATVRNIEELVDLLPGLNVLDDPDLKRSATRSRPSSTATTPRPAQEQGRAVAGGARMRRRSWTAWRAS